MQKYDSSFVNCIEAADYSAAGLVNLLAQDFPCFRDEVRFENRKTCRILKRAQILVADIWACFEETGYGDFSDIDKLTIFADYRIPQLLHAWGCLQYSPLVRHTVQTKIPIESGHTWEVQIRGMAMLRCTLGFR